MVGTRTNSFEERVAQVLVEGGFLTKDQLSRATEAMRTSGTGLLDTMVSQNMVSQDTLVTVLSFQLRIPVVDLRRVEVDAKAVQLVAEEYARQHTVLPIAFDADGSLRVATRMPNDFQRASELSSMTGHEVKFVLALGGQLEQLIDRTYAAIPREKRPPQAGAPTAAAPAPGGTAVARVEAASSAGVFAQDVGQLPAVQAVDMVTLQAVKRRASDLHLVPSPDSARVLFRIDGVLQQMAVLPLTLHETMVSRVKVLAGMNISESRRPQDGNFSLNFGERKVDFRVSTIGATWGEMMVIRVLDQSQGLMTLKDLGLESTPLIAWRHLLSYPQGIVLVSGPTGSGKTTTLYASVMELVKGRGNIITIEDPIERRLEDINQIPVNRAAGVDFPSGLRSILRLDPDIILVGEIRDADTAKTAVDAALTGHLVMASIHSNDASGTVVRLLDLDIEPFLAASALIGVLAQRLVRKICPQCKVLKKPAALEAMAYEQEMKEAAEEFWVGEGCNFCGGTGYMGRTGVFEVLGVDDNIKRLIASSANSQQIRAQAISNGMVPLRAAGMRMAKEGLTTLDEVLKKVFFID